MLLGLGLHRVGVGRVRDRVRDRVRVGDRVRDRVMDRARTLTLSW